MLGGVVLMRKVFKIMKRLLLAHLAATAGLTAILSAGAAYAFFSGSGSGTGSAPTGALQTVSLVAVTGTPESPLQPGSTGDVLLNVSNSNARGVTLVSVIGDGPITVTGGTGCTSATSGVTFTDQKALSIAIPGSASASPVDLSGAATMSYSSASACQGAVFNIPVTITVHS